MSVRFGLQTGPSRTVLAAILAALVLAACTVKESRSEYEERTRYTPGAEREQVVIGPGEAAEFVDAVRRR